MTVLRRAGYLTRPWRNGGGVSHEIAWAENEDWRLGLAEIVQDGPFSDYSGFDRTLTIVQGEGLWLNEHALADAPHAFRGEEAVLARVTSGPLVVLNAITRRGRFAHAVRRLPATTRLEGVQFVTAIGGEVRVAGETLQHLDTLRLDHRPAEATGSGELIAVTFT